MPLSFFFGSVTDEKASAGEISFKFVEGLETYDLEEFLSKFVDEDIDIEDFHSLRHFHECFLTWTYNINKDDLCRLGIVKIGEQKRFYRS